MLSVLQSIVLALVQGITEFLPISSSAHLILTSQVLSWPDQGTAFDLALHVGTLLAVVLYFRHDVWELLRDWLISVATRRTIGQSRLAWLLILSTIPTALAGFFLLDYIEQLRNANIIIATTVFYAILLFAADYWGRKQRLLLGVGWRDALIIGLAQALSLIPGTSRSGITITAALALGLNREAASRFSFLLAIPITFLAAVGKITSDSFQANTAQGLPWLTFLLGAGVSFITAIIAIHFFLKCLNRYGMLPYVIYRLLLGGFLFYVFYW